MHSIRVVRRQFCQLISLNNHQSLILQNRNYCLTLDDFVNRLHNNRIRPKLELGIKPIKPDVEKIFPNSEPVRSPRLKKFKSSIEDSLVDNLMKSYTANSLDECITILERYKAVKRYPSRETLTKLASITAQKSSIEHLKVIQESVKEAFPKEYEWQMGYQHFYAEALYRCNGDFKQAITIFEELFLKFPKRRKKLFGLYKFLTTNIILKNRNEELDFLVDSAIRVAKCGINHPVANVWYQVFISDSGTMQYKSWTIIESCPEIKDYVAMKIDDILELSRNEKRIDTVQRLLETILRLQIEKEYSKVCNELVNYQCAYNDVAGALESYRYMKEQQILLEETTLARLSNLISGGRRTQTPVSKCPLDL